MSGANFWLRRRSGRRYIVATALLVSQTFACSQLMVAGPSQLPPTPPSFGPPGQADASTLPPLACMRQKFAPHFDIAVASMFGLSGLASGALGTGLLISELGSDGDSYNQMMSFFVIGAGLIGMALALPWYASARSGYRNVAACRAEYALRGL